MRALLDRSYELLTPTEQALLHRAVLFVGGFEPAAAQVLAADGAVEAAELLEN